MVHFLLPLICYSSLFFVPLWHPLTLFISRFFCTDFPLCWQFVCYQTDLLVFFRTIFLQHACNLSCTKTVLYFSYYLVVFGICKAFSIRVRRTGNINFREARAMPTLPYKNISFHFTGVLRDRFCCLHMVRVNE